MARPQQIGHLMHKTYAVKSGSMQARQNTREAIANREKFRTSGALSGGWNCDMYEVYSYNAVIATWDKRHGWTVNTHRYSMTTGIHQSVVRAALRIAGLEFATDEWVW